MTDPVHALLIIDVQRAFVTGPGAAPASGPLLGNVGALLERARDAGALVVQLQNDGPPGAVDEPGGEGWQLYFEAGASDRETVIRKSADDGFDGTPLEETLRRHGVDRLCVVGLMSEMCVLATARSAIERGFGVVLPHNGHATFDIGPAPGDSEGVPAAMASRVAEWALGDEVEIITSTTDVSFTPVDWRETPGHP
ncbi:isochorismatase family protein [Microlunatus parietis]|uniref:Nicotinamidase-related amidase n=1 Tax=Microlunatus parietis TaxID=682979 RepID=A0A7Y9I942_9ACTN|nr:isochorismatase family protein [Microlunatus parietis]NYE72034.1 nicotinamidase-related amidase [Microlunatus parietis]